MGLLSNSNAIESGGYNIDRSLRFRGSANGYLSKAANTWSPNKQTFTISFWFKRGTTNGSWMDVISTYDGVGGGREFLFMFSNGVSGGSDQISIGNYTGAADWLLTTNQVFRDPSAWYHIVVAVDTTQATASNRAKMYINGVQVTSFATATYPSLNFNNFIGVAGYGTTIGTWALAIWSSPSFGRQYDGYLAEMNWIDGQALTPSSFGEFSTETGVWTPKKYTGTYGTNGFYLDFKDNTSATTLAYDKSGNGNNWTANNISTTAGATYDSMTDVPTLTSATAANFATWLALRPTFSQGNYKNGNLEWYQTSAGSGSYVCSSIAAFSGKWYAEFSFSGNVNSSSSFVGFGTMYSVYPLVGYRASGQSEVPAAFGASYTTGDIIGVAYDSSTNTATFYKNGVQQGTQSFTVDQLLGGAFVAATIGTGSTIIANFGQRPFSYTPPTGFKALNTFNLPDPTIKKPNQYMDVATWTAQTPSTTLTNNGDGTWNINLTGITTGADLVWGKCRNVGHNHALQDSARGFGSGKNLTSNGTGSEGSDNDGYVISTSGNTVKVNTGNAFNGTYTAGQTYVGWFWKESATAGFDIVTYTGTETNRTVVHNLGVAPKFMICKVRDYAPENWFVWHSAFSGTEFIMLDSTNAKGTSTNLWNSTIPTSSVFSLGTSASANRAGKNFVAYLFAEIPGYSKFGSYTGNGSADGPFVYCGFRPKYVMVKQSSGASDWVVVDSSRATYNVVSGVLRPNLSDAEASNGDYGIFCDFLSNGFKMRSASTAGNTGTVIFAAFAENPFKYSNAR